MIANKQWHLDLDKLDYLMRDAYYAGRPSFTLAQVLSLFLHSRLVDGRWEVHESQRSFVVEIFEQRASMFREIYTCPDERAVEARVVRALRQVDTKHVEELEEVDVMPLVLALAEPATPEAPPEAPPLTQGVEEVLRKALFYDT